MKDNGWRPIFGQDKYEPMIELKKEHVDNVAVLRVAKSGAELLREGWTHWREMTR